MFRLYNKLFGWDYIQWSNFADSGISRIRVDAEGIPYYFRYSGVDIIDRLGTNREVGLTCS